MSDFLLWEQDGPVVTLTMNRPDERNTLSTPDIFDAFEDACRRIDRDLGIRCVILTGAGPAFCAGGNIKQMRDKTGIAAGSPADIRATYRHGLQRLPTALWNLEVPVIAAVNGPAIGAGCDLACLCDMRIASETARFAVSFVKLGIVPADGGAWLLPRVVGHAKAAEMIFTGDAIRADEALKLGLVSAVTAPDALMVEARALARRVAANPPQALRMSKRLLREADGSSLATVLEMSAAMQALAHHAADHDEAVAAFMEKRPPTFQGR
ncbi:MAG: crotonase/enoyl-CoA hydratase family protein [Pseudomonadota bacterium]